MNYLCIDLKCFYASCECVDRMSDPMTTPLVVCDVTRGKGAICLAVSPKMKELGVKNRCRINEIPNNINYIVAKPRMSRYIEMSSFIYEIYLKYVSSDDIYVYSIDEVFIDVSSYKKLYNKTAIEIGEMIINDVYKTTNIKATCGAGDNLFLAKVAMDMIAKKNKNNIGCLDVETFMKVCTHVKPLSSFWQIGTGIERRLNKLNIYTFDDINKTDEEILYKEFGVNAYYLINHAKGIDNETIESIKAYKPVSKTISLGQVLEEDYSFKNALIVLKEMVNLLTLDLISKNLLCEGIYLAIGYSGFDDKIFSKSKKLDKATNSYSYLINVLKKIYIENVDPNKEIRRINLSFTRLQKNQSQNNLFNDNKEENVQKTIIDIQNKYGKSKIIRAISLEDKATTLKRNKMIGGHNA